MKHGSGDNAFSAFRELVWKEQVMFELQRTIC